MTQSILDNLEAANTYLEERFADKLHINPILNRQLVSFQANKTLPVYRWFKYKEAFSEALVHYILDELGIEHGKILDPFAGTGTALFATQENGLDTVGIELLPIGCEIMEVRQLIRGNEAMLGDVIHRWLEERPWQKGIGQEFQHLKITKGAFSEETQTAIERYLAATKQENTIASRFLRFAALCILEDVSYTRKDGQYLRWDYRSDRQQGAKPFNKGKIASFDDAIMQKLAELYADLQPHATLNLFSHSKKRGSFELLRGSCLELLPTLKTASFDGIITSPP